MRRSPHCHWRPQVHYIWVLVMKKESQFLMSRSTLLGTEGQDISFLCPSAEAPCMPSLHLDHASSIYSHVILGSFGVLIITQVVGSLSKLWFKLCHTLSSPSHFPDFSACEFLLKIICWIFFSKGKHGLFCRLFDVLIITSVLEISSDDGFFQDVSLLPVSKAGRVTDTT